MEYLAAGQTKIESFTVTLNDGHGGVVNKQVDITISGTNDAPVFSTVPATGAVTETTSPTAVLTSSGTIGFTDVDLTDAHVVSASAIGSALGTLVATKTKDTTGTGTGGTIAYTYSVTDSQIAYLTAGQKKVESFNVKLDDGKGGVVTKQVDVTITGIDSNHQPVIVASAASNPFANNFTIETIYEQNVLTVMNNDVIALSLDVNGNLTNDPDKARLTVGLTANAVGYTSDTIIAGQIYTPTGALSTSRESDPLDPNTFHLSDAELQALVDQHKAGLYFTDPSQFKAFMATFPAGAVGASVTEQQATTNANLTSTGTISFTDADITDTHTVSVVANGQTAGSLVATETGDATNGARGTIAYTYTVAASTVAQLSGNGDSRLDSFNVVVNDGHGGVTSQEVDFALVGTNDAPVFAAGGATGSVTEQVTPNGNLTTSGTVGFSDADVNDTHTVSVIAIGSTAGTLAVSETTVSLGTGTGGIISYTYTVADSAVEGLGAGQTKLESFNVVLNDENGGVATKRVDITINGTNNAPVISAPVYDPVLENIDFNDAIYTAGHSTGAYVVSYVDDKGYRFNDYSTANPQNFGSKDSDGTAIYVTYSNIRLPDGSVGEISRPDGLEFGLKSFDVGATPGTGSGPSSITLNGYDKGVLVASQIVNFGANFSTAYFGASWAKVDDIRIKPNAGFFQFFDNVQVVSPGTAQSLIEQAGTTGSALIDTTSVRMAFTDDISDFHTTQIKLASVSLSVGAVSIATSNALAQAASVVENDSIGTGTGSINTTLKIADSAVDFLSSGETLTAIYNVTVSDGSLASTQPVVFTIIGTNDAPLIASADKAETGLIFKQNVQNGPSLDQTSGTIHFSDVDATDAPTATVGTQTVTAFDTDGVTPLQLTAAQVAAVKGAFSIKPESGNTNVGVIDWTYAIGDSNLAFVTTGQTIKVASQVNIADGNGGVDSSVETVKINGPVNNGFNPDEVYEVLVADSFGQYVLPLGIDANGYLSNSADTIVKTVAVTATAGNNIVASKFQVFGSQQLPRDLDPNDASVQHLTDAQVQVQVNRLVPPSPDVIDNFLSAPSLLASNGPLAALGFASQVVVNDAANAGGSKDAILAYDLQQAINQYAQHITGAGTLVVELNVTPTSDGRSDGGPSATYAVGTNDGKTVEASAALYALTTGQHLAGTTSDITIHVSPSYFANLDLSKPLNFGDASAPGTINPVDLFMHELGHGFGIDGDYSQSGSLNGSQESTFDTLIHKNADGTASYIGSAGDAAYGGAVPLTTSSTTGENYYHFGNMLSDFAKAPSAVQDPLTLDLMNGVAFYKNHDYALSALDLGVMSDLGYHLINAALSASSGGIATASPSTPMPSMFPTITAQGSDTLNGVDLHAASV